MKVEQQQTIYDIGCIVGAVVQIHPDFQGSASIKQRLQDLGEIEIHAEDGKSRLVITIEATTSLKVMKITEDIQHITGVLQITPVYQHCETNPNNDATGGWRWR